MVAQTARQRKPAWMILLTLFGGLYLTNIQRLNAASSPPTSAQSTALAAFIQTARQRHLGEDRTWLKQIFYIKRWHGGFSALVDSPAFYLAADGDKNPQAELEATLAGIFAPLGTDTDTKNAHARCRFPARYHVLTQLLPDLAHSLPANVDCPALQTWQQVFEPHGVSLVYSTGYMNNPASMYGHTYLRIHRRPQNKRRESPALLDHAVNFAANPTTKNVLFYSIMGLTGQFQGTFSLMPYYLKVQEYNNAESRDLWEYPLQITPEEVQHIVHSLWEVGPHPVDYYYFDENCSFVILSLLDTARPDLRLTDNFAVYVIPGDTLRAAQEVDGFLGPPVFRASLSSQYEGRLAQLNETEKDLVRVQYAKQSLDPELHKLPVIRQAAVLDTMLDLIDYRERAAGSKLPEKQKTLRTALLAERARLASASHPLNLNPTINQRPDRGHPSGRVAFGLGRRVEKNFANLDMRGALHDLASPSPGYRPDLQIIMFAMNLEAIEGERVYLDRYTLFDALSIPAYDRTLHSLSWKFSIGGRRDYPELSQHCLSHDLAGHGGLTWRWLDARFYGLAGGRMGWDCAPSKAAPHGASTQFHLGLGGIAGLSWQTTEALSFNLQSEAHWLCPIIDEKSAEQRWLTNTTATLNLAIAKNKEWRATLERRATQSQASLNFGYYF